MTDAEVLALRERVIGDVTELVETYKAEGKNLIVVAAFLHIASLTMSKAIGIDEDRAVDFVRCFYSSGMN